MKNEAELAKLLTDIDAYTDWAVGMGRPIDPTFIGIRSGIAYVLGSPQRCFDKCVEDHDAAIVDVFERVRFMAERLRACGHAAPTLIVHKPGRVTH